MFFNVTMTEIGLQTIVASDIADGSILGLATLMVVGADVKFFKEPRLSVAASGDTIQFRVCWSNYSSATATSFVVTDAIPQGTTYVPDVDTDMICGTTAPVPSIQVSYSSSASATPPATFTDASGLLPSTAQWLRWTIKDVFVRSSGCVCYRVRID